MRNIMFIFCALFFLNVSPAYAETYINNLVPKAEKVGEGRLTYVLWDVYDATLYAPEGNWQQDKPFALQLVYLRKLEGKKIADRSVEEMRKQGISDEIKLADWHAQMRKIIPDVNEGARLTGVRTNKKETVFYKNKIEIGRIKDPDFSEAFFGIWLNKKTSAPDLRKKLLGKV